MNLAEIFKDYKEGRLNHEISPEQKKRAKEFIENHLKLPLKLKAELLVDQIILGELKIAENA